MLSEEEKIITTKNLNHIKRFMLELELFYTFLDDHYSRFQFPSDDRPQYRLKNCKQLEDQHIRMKFFYVDYNVDIGLVTIKKFLPPFEWVHRGYNEAKLKEELLFYHSERFINYIHKAGSSGFWTFEDYLKSHLDALRGFIKLEKKYAIKRRDEIDRTVFSEAIFVKDNWPHLSGLYIQ